MLQAGPWEVDLDVSQQQSQAGEFWGLEKVIMVLIQPDAQDEVDGPCTQGSQHPLRGGNVL